MKKLFFYPQHPGTQAINPYCDNYLKSVENYYDIVRTKNRHLPRGLDLLIHSLKADVYVLNWLESISSLRCGFIQTVLAVLALCVVHMRRKRIVWMFHNIHPHYGENTSSRLLKKLLFKWSILIIAHSKEAAEYAKKFAKGDVRFRVHPMEVVDYGTWDGAVRDCDYFCWGSIHPYKGTVDLLENSLCQKSRKRILIIGKCVDDSLRKKIEELAKDNVVYENRSACYSEIAAQCKKAAYVLFPYVGDGVSSSGVLMDTLLMGGIPVGPDRGAFSDLAEQGCCITYNNLDEVFSLPTDEHRLKLDPQKVNAFIENNIWSSFGDWLYNTLESI